MSDPILIVDDDKNIRYSLKRLLEGAGYSVIEATSGELALTTVESQNVSLILLDIQMKGISGLETLNKIKELNQHIPVIMLTAFGTTQNAIEATKRGAYEYVLKPFNPEELLALITRALDVSRMMQQEVRLSLMPEADSEKEGDTIIGSSPKMQEVYKTIGRIAQNDVTVLLRGESGTGKELVARAIYQHSLRSNKVFLPVNCAAIPENLLESELFGHEKGAFTNAQQTRIGKFEQCHGGTLFLDEIGDLSLSTQAKILRVLQEKEFQRVGSNTLIKSDVRLLAATHRDLEKMIQKKEFREDLYYRLNVVSIHLPPLRERGEDILQLAEYFIKKFSRMLNKKEVQLTEKSKDKLMKYAWPGNVRELENCIHRAIVLNRNNTIDPDELIFTPSSEFKAELPKEMFSPDQLADQLFKLFKEAKSSHPAEEIWEELEKRLITQALEHTGGNQLQAAKLIGLNRNTVRKKIADYQIQIQTKIS